MVNTDSHMEGEHKISDKHKNSADEKQHHHN